MDETVSYRDDANKSFSSFYNKFNKIVNKHVPMRTISKRKTKQLSKPWITKGIRTSTKIKNKLFTSGNRAQYILYRNKICRLTRLSKKQYYHEYFESNFRNMKKTWERTNKILNRRKVNFNHIDSIQNPKNENKITRDVPLIPNILNEHFATVGSKLANQLSQSEKHFNDFLSKSKSPECSFYFEPITATEVKSEFLLFQTINLIACILVQLKY